MHTNLKIFYEKKEFKLNELSSVTTPCFLYDPIGLDEAITSFKKTFLRHIPSLKIYYAVKSNPYDRILQQCSNHGIGLDVSGEPELVSALKNSNTGIIFTGPGKTDPELTLAIKNADRVTVHIDSFSELERLGKLSNSSRNKIKAGIRVTTPYHGYWNKFGIPLSQLGKFWHEAQKYKFIDLCGIQAHMSWNTDATAYVSVLKEIADFIRNNFSGNQIKQIRFIDIGGGFIPDSIEGDYAECDLEKNIVKPPQYSLTKSFSLDRFASEIAAAIKIYLNPIGAFEYYVEPGRIISYASMHILLRIADKKNEKVFITDGGTNMIGWEKFEEIYAPVLNLTHPSATEKPVLLYGSLCTPHDIWGYYCYADRMERGDLLIIPNQGAYTYTLAQQFIKPFPDVAAEAQLSVCEQMRVITES